MRRRERISSTNIVFRDTRHGGVRLSVVYGRFPPRISLTCVAVAFSFFQAHDGSNVIVRVFFLALAIVRVLHVDVGRVVFFFLRTRTVATKNARFVYGCDRKRAFRVRTGNRVVRSDTASAIARARVLRNDGGRGSVRVWRHKNYPEFTSPCPRLRWSVRFIIKYTTPRSEYYFVCIVFVSYVVRAYRLIIIIIYALCTLLV